MYTKQFADRVRAAYPESQDTLKALEDDSWSLGYYLKKNSNIDITHHDIMAVSSLEQLQELSEAIHVRKQLYEFWLSGKDVRIDCRVQAKEYVTQTGQTQVVAARLQIPRALFTFSQIRNVIVIRDVSEGAAVPTVTNDIENVINYISRMQGFSSNSKAWIYRDSDGNWDGYDVNEKDFYSLNTQDLEQALNSPRVSARVNSLS